MLDLSTYRLGLGATAPKTLRPTSGPMRGVERQLMKKIKYGRSNGSTPQTLCAVNQNEDDEEDEDSRASVLGRRKSFPATPSHFPKAKSKRI